MLEKLIEISAVYPLRINKSIGGSFFKHRYNAISTHKSNTLDIDYFVSLVDRGTEQSKNQTTLTPEKWPSVSIRSTVFSDEPEEAYPKTSQTNSSNSFDSGYLWMTPFNSEEEAPNSLDEVLDKQFSKPSSKDTNSIFSSIKSVIQALKSDDIKMDSLRMFPKVERKIYSVRTEIHFPDLKEKKITDILCKSMAFGPINEADSTTIPTNSNGEEGLTLSVGDGEDSGGEERLLNFEDNLISKTEMVTPKKILILPGKDLHLLEYSQITSLIKLYNIEAKDSRNSIERRLCSFFKDAIKAGREVEIFKELEVNSDETDLKVFVKKITKPESDVMATKDWNAELDQSLIEITEKVRDARRILISRVDEYLHNHGININDRKKELADDSSLWEVVAKYFPGHLPKNCKKRWVLLQRIECMEPHAIS